MKLINVVRSGFVSLIGIAERRREARLLRNYSSKSRRRARGRSLLDNRGKNS